jgi:hypothetical protein
VHFHAECSFLSPCLQIVMFVANADIRAVGLESVDDILRAIQPRSGCM